MSKQSRRPRRNAKKPIDAPAPKESRPADALTIAWTSAVTAVVVADLVLIAAHFYARGNPDAMAAKALEAIMLLTAAGMGMAALVLSVVVWKVRKLKPPTGYTAFATFVALLPVVALIARMVQ